MELHGKLKYNVICICFDKICMIYDMISDSMMPMLMLCMMFT